MATRIRQIDTKWIHNFLKYYFYAESSKLCKIPHTAKNFISLVTDCVPLDTTLSTKYTLDDQEQTNQYDLQNKVSVTVNQLQFMHQS